MRSATVFERRANGSRRACSTTFVHDTDKQLAEADQQLAAEAKKLREEMKSSVPALAKADRIQALERREVQ